MVPWLPSSLYGSLDRVVEWRVACCDELYKDRKQFVRDYPRSRQRDPYEVALA